jgi:hypothetical protein
MTDNSKNKKTIEIIEKALKEIILTDNHYNAFLFFTKLEKLLNTTFVNTLSKEELSLYEDMIIKAKFVGLYRLDEKEVIDLINAKFNYISKIRDYDILDKIDFFLTSNFYFFDDRNEWKKKMRDVLSESNTEITEKEIDLNNEKVKPSITNWLNDFRTNYLEEGFLDVLKISEYISNSKNLRNLSEEEKKKVEILIKLYAHLKLDSNKEGMEESFLMKDEEGNLGRLEKGSFRKLDENLLKETYALYEEITGEKIQDENKISKSHSNKKVFIPEEETKEDVKEVEDNKKSVEKLLESYKSFEMDLKGIEPIIKGLEKYQNNPDGLFIKFNKDLEQEDSRDNLLSAVVFICQNKLLDKFLQENEKLLIEFKKYLSFKLSDDIIKSILNKSTSPETVSLYLQFLLFKKIKLSPKNAGLFGMHLANIFKKIGQDKYFPIVYGDVNLEQFVWREVIEENGLVKFK